MGFVNVAAYEAAGNDATKGAKQPEPDLHSCGVNDELRRLGSRLRHPELRRKSTVTATAPALYNAPKATIIDGQLQGSLGTMPVGFYASYGTAAASTSTETNPFNTNLDSAGGKAKTSFNVSAELGFAPHTPCKRPFVWRRMVLLPQTVTTH